MLKAPDGYQFVRKPRQRYHLARRNKHTGEPIIMVECSSVITSHKRGWPEQVSPDQGIHADDLCLRCAGSVFGPYWSDKKRASNLEDLAAEH